MVRRFFEEAVIKMVTTNTSDVSVNEVFSGDESNPPNIGSHSNLCIDLPLTFVGPFEVLLHRVQGEHGRQHLKTMIEQLTL